jgi:hypothetical protein
MPGFWFVSGNTHRHMSNNPQDFNAEGFLSGDKNAAWLLRQFGLPPESLGDHEMKTWFLTLPPVLMLYLDGNTEGKDRKVSLDRGI